MINWFKSLDVYGWFLFIVLGIPGFVFFFHVFGGIGLMAYADMVGAELNWFALFAMIVFMGPICLAITHGLMGGFRDSEESAEGFVKGWGAFVLATIILIVIPALTILGLAKLGVYEYLRALIA